MNETLTAPIKLLHADELPRQQTFAYITIRPKAWEVSLSKALLQLMGIEQDNAVSLFPNGKGWYITRVGSRGFKVQVTSRYVKSSQRIEVSGGVINSKQLVLQLMEQFGFESDQVMRVPVTRHEIAVNDDSHPFPIRRLILDQKQVSSAK
ncbi:hypothetical protein GCM10028805_22650 [Spirosoma harenae]